MKPLARAVYLSFGWIGTAPLFAPLHGWVYRALGGRLVGKLLGVEIVLVTTRGRKSGRPRSAPLMGVRDRGRLLVVASNAGKDRPPDWYLNLRADPEVTVQIGPHVAPMRARVASGPELGPLWETALRAYPGYAVYREVARRRIPLVVLEPSATTREVHPSH